MPTTMVFAGNLTDDPQLLHGRDGKPSVSYRVAVRRRIQKAVGERFDVVPAGHTVTVYRTAANLYDPAGGCCRVVVHGQLRREFSRDSETGEERIKQVVSVGDRFGEADPSLNYGVTRLERQIAPTVATEI